MITSSDLSVIPEAASRAVLTSARIEASERAARVPTPGPAGGEAGVETALLDTAGVIVWVDHDWDEFCRANGGNPARAGVGRSYLALCDAAAPTDAHSATVASAIRAALRGDLPAPARVRVPCDAPTQPRVFDVLISSRRDDHGRVLGATVTLSEVVSTTVAAARTGSPRA